jgi:hypothetical protein
MGLLDIKPAKVEKLPIVTIHGETKTRKTQFGLDAPKPLFLAFEEGFGNREHTAIRPKSTDEMREVFKELVTTKHEFKTLVIDSLDHLAPMIAKEICESAQKTALADFGFGKGYELEGKEWLRLFKGLERLRDSGLLIICICHSQTRQIEDPDMAAPYDHIELKLPKKAAAITRELSDVIGAVREDKSVITDPVTKKTKICGSGQFILHLNPTPAVVAGNRYRMGGPIPFTFPSFAEEWLKANPREFKPTTTENQGQ